MKFFETSKYFSLKKSTYINLRWIAIIGQLITVNLIYFVFDFRFNLILANSTILIGVLSNLYLIYINQNTQLTDKIAFIFLSIDTLQLSCLIYLTGGIINPFSIFLIIPAIFSSSNLGFRSNLLLVSLTVLVIIFLTFFNQPLPYPISEHFHVDSYYYYSIPIALIIALLFLNYFALTFGSESRIRKEALNKMEEIMSKEHELLSLGGQAAAAAHSLGTPFSTMKIISTDLLEQFKDNEDVKKDIELLSGQLERCSDILKKLTLNPVIEDDFIDSDFKDKYDCYNHLNEMGCKSVHARKMRQFYIDCYNETVDVYNADDDYLNEAWGHLKPKYHKKIMDFYGVIVDDIDRLIKNSTAQRKPRKKKTLSATPSARYLTVSVPV